MATLRKGIAALAGVGAVAAVGQHLASAPSRVHPLLQAYHAGGRTAATGSRAASSLPGKALPVFETNWPSEWPFSPEDFKRFDIGSDLAFYNAPRIVHHIDEAARAALTEFYAAVFTKDASSSNGLGMGMNDVELAKNEMLDSYTVQDLNEDTTFPAADNTFDIVTCVVSIDYLVKPRKVLAEIWRVLKPGGRVIFSQSNRCFPGKVIGIWHRTSDMEHLYIIG
eukprot:gene17526-24626_t